MFAGQMDRLDGDINAFAHGCGRTQFPNTGFVFDPIVSATMPYVVPSLRSAEPSLIVGTRALGSF